MFGKSQMSEKSRMSKNKSTFEVTKDHGRTLEELNRFQKPNLDDDDRFFMDNKRIVDSFNPNRIADLFDPEKTVKKAKKKP